MDKQTRNILARFYSPDPEWRHFTQRFPLPALRRMEKAGLLYIHDLAENPLQWNADLTRDGYRELERIQDGKVRKF